MNSLQDSSFAEVKEAILSLKIRNQLSKQEILEGYLNTIYFGRGAYGIQAAAQAYFDRDAKKLNLLQSAVLSAVLNNPSLYDPANGEDARDRLEARVERIIDAMLEMETVDPDEAQAALERGLPVFPRIKQDEQVIRCLMLTAYDDEDALRAAVIAGADGYVLKDIRGSSLLDGIRAAARGKRLIDPRVASRVSTQLKEPADDPRFASLGLRERQVLALIADGFTNRQIGEKLGLAEKTVKNYVSSLLAKLGLERRTQAAVLQLEHRGRA